MSLLALQDLFRRYREKATGIWRLGREPGRTVFLDSGDIVFAQSTHAMDRLTHLLVERGRLTQAQLDYALANLKPGLSIGKNLIEMGFITQRDLLEVARYQVERIVAGALATPGLAPDFEAAELERTVVRLPLESPVLLLNGLLALQDRERILELLGPLNQVVVLQGRRIFEMALPADLAKLPPFLDGTHTLLELSREGLAEPFRLGAFALFLREIGWARLHEMPPIARQALDLALEPEPAAPSKPLPELPLETVPSLFSTIEAAARPTTNLDHLSEAFDAIAADARAVEPPALALPLEEAFPDSVRPSAPVEPDEQGFSVASGQAILPTPAVELPLLPEERGVEVPVSISPVFYGGGEPETPLDPPRVEVPARRRAGLFLGLLLLGGAAGVGWWGWHHRPSRTLPSAPPPVQVAAEPKAPMPPPEKIAAPEPGDAGERQPDAPAVEAEPKVGPERVATPSLPEPAKAAAKPLAYDVHARLETLKKGELSLAVKQGQRRIRDAGKGQWTLRLEIACQGETIRKAVAYFGAEKPDLFLAPITLRDGRHCYQVFFGHFKDQVAAERRIKALPSVFRSHGNRPRAFRFSDIPAKQ